MAQVVLRSGTANSCDNSLRLPSRSTKVRIDARVLAAPTCAPSSTTSIEKDHLPAPSINDGTVSPPATLTVHKPTTCVNDHNQAVIPTVLPKLSSPLSTQPATPATSPSGPFELSRPRRATKTPKKYEP